MSDLVIDFDLQEEHLYAGPHPRQTSWWAVLLRRAMRYKDYTRWTNRYCRPLVVAGAEHLAELRGPAIVIANHQSHMDSLVLWRAMPAHIRHNLYFGAAADRWYVPGKKKLVLKPWYQSFVLGNFPIRRGGGSAALDYARWLLDRNAVINIFPEGTRSTTGRLGRFRPGAALLALEKQVPVIPVFLGGLREMRPKGSRTITPGPAYVHIKPPLYFGGSTTVQSATAKLQRIMDAAYGAHYGEVAAPNFPMPHQPAGAARKSQTHSTYPTHKETGHVATQRA